MAKVTSHRSNNTGITLSLYCRAARMASRISVTYVGDDTITQTCTVLADLISACSGHVIASRTIGFPYNAWGLCKRVLVSCIHS